MNILEQIAAPDEERDQAEKTADADGRADPSDQSDGAKKSETELL